MSQFRFVSRIFSRLSLTLAAMLAATSFAVPGQAQTAPADKSAAPAPDVLVFTNGDQLTGKLLREVSGSVTFHSDMAGDVTVTWDKIKSIHSSQQFAVIQEGQHINRKTGDAAIAHGPVEGVGVAGHTQSGAVKARGLRERIALGLCVARPDADDDSLRALKRRVEIPRVVVPGAARELQLTGIAAL